MIATQIKRLTEQFPKEVTLVAVSKTKPISALEEAYNAGHRDFGENKVQEAETKWLTVKKTNKNLQLHMIGKLQSNKAKKAVELFDYIHSVDNQKLADVLSKSQNAIKVF